MSHLDASTETNELFVGWDVGAWNCDRNRRSRDAVCAVEVGVSGPRVVGRASRRNIRDLLVDCQGQALVDALLSLIGIGEQKGRPVTLALDAPLGWPAKMLGLVTRGIIADVPTQADSNPYLFRAQELALFKQGIRPLSMVRDMMGSQSTKGLHFLRQAQLLPSGTGTWSRRGLVVVETYPAAARRDNEIERLSRKLLDELPWDSNPRGNGWKEDVHDAITCALVARLHRQLPHRLNAPGEEADAAEGWIWLPRST